MKILIAWIDQFVGHNGGMDKVFVRFANEMVRRGHNVTLAYCTEHNGKSYTPIDSRVNVVNVANNLPDKKWESHKTTFFKIKREILRLLNKSHMLNYERQYELDYIQSGIQNLLNGSSPDIIVTMDAKTTSAIKWSDIENRYPLITMSHYNAEEILACATTFEKQMLEKSNIIQVLMPHDIDIFKKTLPGIRLACIPNIVPQYNVSLATKRTNYKIINVARLDKSQKRQHLLIEAFAQIAFKYPEWNVEFWGTEQEGERYSIYLRSLIKKYHLEHQVFLKGNADHVIDIYRNADIFAFPSHHEGFGLAMTEAMSAGLPVIAYQSCAAVNALVKNKKNGLLVNDGIEPLSSGLEWMIAHEEARRAMGQQAQQDMKAYSAEKIWNQWENLLYGVVNCSKEKRLDKKT